MSQKKRKAMNRRRQHSTHQLSPEQRALVRAFAEETALASSSVIEAAVRSALAVAAPDERHPPRHHRHGARRRAVRDMRGRFIGWE